MPSRSSSRSGSNPGRGASGPTASVAAVLAAPIARAVAGVLLGAVLYACVPLKVAHREAGPVPVEVRVDDAAYWLEEWQRTIGLAPDAYKEQLAQREKDHADRPDARNTLRLALLLAEGRPSGRNAGRALDLLQGIEGTAVNDSTRALAALLKQVVSEQRAATDTGEKDRKDLKVAKQRVEELERQLQELTFIEQNIQDRTKK